MSYQRRVDAIVRQFADQGRQPVVLNKTTSNLFRDRAQIRRHKLDLSDLNHVLAVNAQQGWIEAEGLTTFDTLTKAALGSDVLPAVVPELKSITVGGAVAGVGIESSSFRFGLVHETVLEMDVLVGDGRILTCTPDNEFSDLFFGFANSYGSLGYVTRLKLKTIPARPFVAIEHRLFDRAENYFNALAQACDSDVDFVDGVVFAPNEMFITTGRLVNEAPYESDYTFKNIYYRSIRQRDADFLSAANYIWRWDTDWFWCSKNLYLQNPILRRLAGPSRLNSTNYAKIMRWNSRLGLTQRLQKLQGIYSESVIQDIDIPIDRAAQFLHFFQQTVGIDPIWICPTKSPDLGQPFPLFPIPSGRLYINFGFWDVVRSKQPMAPGALNKLIEQTVQDLGGIKSLYSDAYFSREAFADCYGGDSYQALKSKFDPNSRFPGMFEKCVQRH